MSNTNVKLKYNPDKISSPSMTLQDLLKERRISLEELAESIALRAKDYVYAADASERQR